ncbi:unnamed protein product [Allacma fusca]|uniref:Uncharacterized protein n=1 Tax=Allacma fusca TaxID=39272 RepID=A0A8J2JQ23_9HEXA|nr:unnamed protein product [Allacma fusca]
MSPIAPKFLRMYCISMSIISAFGSIHFYEKLDLRVYIAMPMSLVTLLAFSYLWYGKAGKIPKLSRAKSHSSSDDENHLLPDNSAPAGYESQEMNSKTGSWEFSFKKTALGRLLNEGMKLQKLALVLGLTLLCCDWSSSGKLFWSWGPGGGIGKGHTKKKHAALWVHPVYSGKTFPQFGGPPGGIPVYRDYMVLNTTPKPLPNPYSYGSTNTLDKPIVS